MEGTNQNFTSMLRPSNHPLKPTLWAPNAYKTIKRLVELRHVHNHHLITNNMKKIDWEDPKVDPNRWSQIKKIYNRIELRISEIGVDDKDNSEWERAAQWLDTNERKTLSITRFIIQLRNKYYLKRKGNSDA